jgi:hypothetical protein
MRELKGRLVVEEALKATSRRLPIFRIRATRTLLRDIRNGAPPLDRCGLAPPRFGAIHRPDIHVARGWCVRVSTHSQHLCGEGGLA